MPGEGEWHGMADLFQGYAHLRLDGFYRQVQELCYFTVFQIALFYEQEDELAFGWQSVDRGIDLP